MPAVGALSKLSEGLEEAETDDSDDSDDSERDDSEEEEEEEPRSTILGRIQSLMLQLRCWQFEAADLTHVGAPVLEEPQE